MNIYKYELKANFRSTLFFIIALIFLLPFIWPFSPAFKMMQVAFWKS